MGLLPLHIAAGALALVAGFVALFTLKGARTHRKSGMIFVLSMVIMGGTGAVIALVPHRTLSGELLPALPGSTLMGLLSCYLVTTGWLAFQNYAGARRAAWGALVAGIALVAAFFIFGVQALRSPDGLRFTYPAPFYLMFGGVTLLAVAGDARYLRARLDRTQLLARHLWRMCLALFVASASFFLGQARIIPEPIRIMPLLAIPALLPLAVLVFWFVRVKLVKRKSRNSPSAPPTAGAAHSMV